MLHESFPMAGLFGVVVVVAILLFYTLCGTDRNARDYMESEQVK
jgi:hypothetical protein